MTRLSLAVLLLACASTGAAPDTPLTLDLADYVAMPITGKLDGTGQTDGMLARVNSFREEPGGGGRVFVHDLHGEVYILDKTTKALTPYLDFNGRDGKSGLFRKFVWEAGWANGLITFQFDPEYAANGRFYTVHLEEPAVAASSAPDHTRVPAFNTTGYAVTAPIATPGPISREGVLIEWTDTNRSNLTFEGTARELLRLQLNTRIHPLGDIVFNPAARRGDADWRVMYVSVGDGGAGESAREDVRPNPQRLDTMVGKIIRIVPSLDDHAATSTISDNGRYRVPNDNPFATVAGARKEIWALGLRNPSRLHWAIDPSNAADNRLIANTIGLRTWETIDIIHRGANYGYSLREGNESLKIDNFTAPRPAVDRIPIQIDATKTAGEITPAYPVFQYPHKPGGGDAIGSGYLYRGRRIPALRGKYVFSDISTGHLWSIDYRELLKADDNDPDTMATPHEIHLWWRGRSYPTMFPIVEAAYHERGGTDPDLPGRSTVSGNGRADVHFAMDADGELYIFSKSDGMIRSVVRAR